MEERTILYTLYVDPSFSTVEVLHTCNIDRLPGNTKINNCVACSDKKMMKCLIS